jgi:hypothetical protein
VKADCSIYTEAHPQFPALRIEIAVRGTIEIKVRTGGRGLAWPGEPLKKPLSRCAST